MRRILKNQAEKCSSNIKDQILENYKLSLTQINSSEKLILRKMMHFT